jgi:ribonuclease-3
LKNKIFFKYLSDVWGISSQSSIYLKAFKHKSLNPDIHNERLELLGDTVLDLVVTDALFKSLIAENEGNLSQIRAKIVSRKTLNYIGDKLGLREFLECHSSIKNNSDISGNVFEAMVGAIYLDQKWDFTKEKVLSMLKSNLDWESLTKNFKNDKALLYEWAQSNSYDISFNLLEQSLKNNKQFFNVVLMINGDPVSSRKGYNKKTLEAELAYEFVSDNGLRRENT